MCGQVARAIVDAMEHLLCTKASVIKKRGSDTAVAFFQSKNIPLAVASSSPMQLITAALTGLGMTEVFTVVASAESEKLGKPYPGVYLTAAASLGTHCIMIRYNEVPLPSAINGYLLSSVLWRILVCSTGRFKCSWVPL